MNIWEDKLLIQRFEKKFVKSENCWEWKRRGVRYGFFNIKGKSYKSNRLAYIIYSKSLIPKGLFVLHKCDNIFCVNPDHLYLGTQHENNKDTYLRNRRSQKGSRNGNSILDEKLVFEIKRKLKLGIRISDIAEEYNVAYPTIKDIEKNRKWKEVIYE